MSKYQAMRRYLADIGRTGARGILCGLVAVGPFISDIVYAAPDTGLEAGIHGSPVAGAPQEDPDAKEQLKERVRDIINEQTSPDLPYEREVNLRGKEEKLTATKDGGFPTLRLGENQIHQSRSYAGVYVDSTMNAIIWIYSETESQWSLFYTTFDARGTQNSVNLKVPKEKGKGKKKK